MSSRALKNAQATKASPPIRRTPCSSPPMPAPAKPKCWSTASRACCCRARSRRRFCASPTPRPPPRRCSGRLFERLGAWCVADDDDARRRSLKELGASRRRSWRARARCLRKRWKRRAACESKPSTRSANACWRGFRWKQACRRASTLPTKRARRRCWRGRARTRRSPTMRRVEAFRRFAAKLHGEALEGLLDRLALRRADFHRFAQSHQGPIFADAAIRERHGVRAERRKASRANSSRA